MLKFMRIFISILIIIHVIGCSTPRKFVISQEATKNKFNFQVIDKRSDLEKKSKILSYNIANCTYGIYQIGDGQLIPDRMKILSKMIDENLGITVTDKVIEVNKYEIFNNMQPRLRGDVGMFFAAGGRDLTTNHCRKGLASEQNPTYNNTAIVVLDITFNGQKYNNRSVHVDDGNADALSQEKITLRLQKAIYKSINHIISEIKQQSVE